MILSCAPVSNYNPMSSCRVIKLHKEVNGVGQKWFIHNAVNQVWRFWSKMIVEEKQLSFDELEQRSCVSALNSLFPSLTKINTLSYFTYNNLDVLAMNILAALRWYFRLI